MRRRTLGAIVILLAVGATSRSDDKPLDRTELDRRVVTAVYSTALLGTDIFNKGKHDECLRLYQGTLLSLQPLLDHRPKLMTAVKEKMDKAATLKALEAAFVLREALDEIQNEIAPQSKSDAKVEPKKLSLWDRLGGEKAVRAIVKDFTADAAADKKVNFSRDGKFKFDDKAVANLEKLMVELLSELTGGPLPYSSKRDMKTVHAGMKITDEEFDALAAVLSRTLEKHKVPKAETAELMKQFGLTRTLIVEVKGKGM